MSEYAANLIKKTVVGVGHAEKDQVAMMVKMLLPASEARSPDAADALAAALCHAQHRRARARGRHDRQTEGLVDSFDEDGLIVDVSGVGDPASLPRPARCARCRPRARR